MGAMKLSRASWCVLPAKRQEHHQAQNTVIAWVQFAGFQLTTELLARDGVAVRAHRTPPEPPRG